MNDIQDKICQLVAAANPQSPFEFVRKAIADQAISKLNNDILICKECPRCSNIRTICNGSSASEVLIISDSVTEQQAMSQQTRLAPFELATEKKVFDITLSSMNIDTSKIAWMNAVNGAQIVNGRNIAPDQQTIRKCSYFVKEAVRILNPKMIILAGNIALNCFVQDTIYKRHGKMMQVYMMPAFPVYSPTMIKRVKGTLLDERVFQMQEDFIKDMRSAFSFFMRTYPNVKITM